MVRRLCVLLTPFGEPFDRYYRTIYAPSIIQVGLEPIRADSLSRPSQITEDIWKLVQDAVVLVADLSGQNLNVAYEIGLAHASGQPVILVAKDITDVPFDLRHLRVLVYDKNNEEWGSDLRARLVQSLSETLADSRSAVPPYFRRKEAAGTLPRVPAPSAGGAAAPQIPKRVRFPQNEARVVAPAFTASNPISGTTLVLLLAAVLVLGAVVARAIPSQSSFPSTVLDVQNTGDLLRKLISTILVYFMQFGLIAFEAGAVRQSYGRQSAIKNLVVFALSFISYLCIGWRIEHLLNPRALSSLLDVAFSAGCASTVALIVANTITERGTLLINSLCAMMASGVAYPLYAGCLFGGGTVATRWGFVDTAGGSVIHLLGGTFGLIAALWIGPRSNRRAWSLLGRAHVTEMRDSVPLSVIGAFFLWFGWLGFNSGRALTSDKFLVGFINTSIGASGGAVMALLLVLANTALLTRTDLGDPSEGGTLQEIANMERVILGMLGGLVAVTANASIVAPWQAFIEATAGGTVAAVGSAFVRRYLRHLDDPLGAVATHGFAGIVGILCTAIFRPDLCTISGQAFVCAVAVAAGCILASLPCGVLWSVERLRESSRSRFYTSLLHLTAYEQQTGKSSAEFWALPERVEFARARVRAGPQALIGGEDRNWIAAVQSLALSGGPNSELPELFDGIDRLLAVRNRGTPEEQTAIAAIAARADITRLPIVVERVSDHRSAYRPEGVPAWSELDSTYAQTLIVTISELAESFVGDYSVLRRTLPESVCRELEASFRRGYEFLQEIREEQQSDDRLARLAAGYFQRLQRLAAENSPELLPVG